jgi:transketolase
VRTGSLATVVAVGPMLSRTVDAVDGVDVSIVYVTTVAPCDPDTLRAVVRWGSTLIVVEPYYEGTTAAAMSSALADRAVRTVSIGVPRRFLHNYGAPEEHDAALGLDGRGIARRVRSVLGLG